MSEALNHRYNPCDVIIQHLWCSHSLVCQTWCKVVLWSSHPTCHNMSSNFPFPLPALTNWAWGHGTGGEIHHLLWSIKKLSPKHQHTRQYHNTLHHRWRSPRRQLFSGRGCYEQWWHQYYHLLPEHRYDIVCMQYSWLLVEVYFAIVYNI